MKGYTIGTLEMWSKWFDGTEEVNHEKICKDVESGYNELNVPRGFWGRLLNPVPVRFVYRRATKGALQARFFCHLRIYKLISDEPAVN